MLQSLFNVPRPLSHQHQKLQSSTHCFHCSTTCSPIHMHTHTCSLILLVTTPTSVSLNPLLLSLHSFYLCHWKDPPPLLSSPFYPPALRFLLLFHLFPYTPAPHYSVGWFLMLLTRCLMQQYVLQSDTRGAIQKHPYVPPPADRHPPTHSTPRSSCNPAAWGLLWASDMSPWLQSCKCIGKKEWMWISK